MAGLIIAANTNSVNANSLGLWIELDAILAVVIGGTSLAGGRFSLTGTVIGALFIATLARTIPNIGIPVEANYLFKAVVVILICLLQSPKAAYGGPRPGWPSAPRRELDHEHRHPDAADTVRPGRGPTGHRHRPGLDVGPGARLHAELAVPPGPRDRWPSSSACSASAAPATTGSPTRRCSSACCSTTAS